MHHLPQVVASHELQRYRCRPADACTWSAIPLRAGDTSTTGILERAVDSQAGFNRDLYLVQLFEDFAEVPAACPARHPLRRAHRPLGKSTPRKGFVLQLDYVVLRASLDHVNARCIALAH